MYSEYGIYGFNSAEKRELQAFECKLGELLQKKLERYRQIIVLCIGSDYYVGDCLGPLVGHKLVNEYLNNLIVYGTLQEPVYAANLKETIKVIYDKYDNPLILAIDSSLDSNSKVIGDITLREDGISPGMAFGKSLPYVGDISILGIVNLSGMPFEEFLQTTRMHLIMTMADFIVKGLSNALNNVLSSYKKLRNKTYFVGTMVGQEVEANNLGEAKEILCRELEALELDVGSVSGFEVLNDDNEEGE